jgi:hypothetical protein
MATPITQQTDSTPNFQVKKPNDPQWKKDWKDFNEQLPKTNVIKVPIKNIGDTLRSKTTKDTGSTVVGIVDGKKKRKSPSPINVEEDESSTSDEQSPISKRTSDSSGEERQSKKPAQEIKSNNNNITVIGSKPILNHITKQKVTNENTLVFNPRKALFFNEQSNQVHIHSLEKSPYPEITNYSFISQCCPGHCVGTSWKLYGGSAQFIKSSLDAKPLSRDELVKALECATLTHDIMYGIINPTTGCLGIILGSLLNDGVSLLIKWCPFDSKKNASVQLHYSIESFKRFTEEVEQYSIILTPPKYHQCVMDAYYVGKAVGMASQQQEHSKSSLIRDTALENAVKDWEKSTHESNVAIERGFKKAEVIMEEMKQIRRQFDAAKTTEAIKNSHDTTPLFVKVDDILERMKQQKQTQQVNLTEQQISQQHQTMSHHIAPPTPIHRDGQQRLTIQIMSHNQNVVSVTVLANLAKKNFGNKEKFVKKSESVYEIQFDSQYGVAYLSQMIHGYGNVDNLDIKVSDVAALVGWFEAASFIGIKKVVTWAYVTLYCILTTTNMFEILGYIYGFSQKSCTVKPLLEFVETAMSCELTGNLIEDAKKFPLILTTPMTPGLISKIITRPRDLQKKPGFKFHVPQEYESCISYYLNMQETKFDL